MKRTVRVTIEKEFDIDIPDHLLSDENIQSFEDFMWEIEDEDKREGLFKYAARCAAYDWDFVEGLGYIGEAYMREFMKNPESYIVVSEKYDDCEEEIIRSKEVVETHGGLN
jgi:hypothetical protein